MRIVYPLASSWGGIPHYTAWLANAVSKYVEVKVLKPMDSNDKLFSKNVEVIKAFKPAHFSPYEREGLKALSLKNFMNILSFRNLKLIKEIKPDIVHFTELPPQFSLYVFLHKLYRNYPIISTFHQVYKSPLHTFELPFLLNPKNFVYLFLRRSITEFLKHLVKFDRIIVHTQKCRYTLIERGIDDKKIVVIPHGALTPFRKSTYENEHAAETQENYLLFFGSLRENKGIEYLIKAITIVSRKIPNIKLIIAGEGNLSKYLRLIEDWKKFEIYNEYIPDEKISELFHRAKIVVLPYLSHRGHSGVLLQSFSYGRPVIVTNVGSLPELVIDGEAGLVIPPKNSEALAKAIISLLEDNVLRKKMGKNALKMAEKLSWDNIARMHLRVYEEVLNERRS